MMILGINAYHGDVSAVLLRDGELFAAVEEERFRRRSPSSTTGATGPRSAGERATALLRVSMALSAGSL
jgi:predicted NodU family carbamoyl transferase